ncbi:MAG TPA: serine hydrolase [Candidatus Saccharimonadales bacterium]|jgi:beta-lactamase class A|nr:serine hydrolase [Candidatus Saccharimonadales bacterium]
MVTPTSPTVDLANTQQVQKAAGPMSESSLQDPGKSDMIKKIILRFLTESSVVRNQWQGVQTTGVEVRDLQDNSEIVSNEVNTPQFAASVNKLPVTLMLLEDLRNNKITLDTQLTWQASDRRDGAGVYDQPGSVMQASVKDVLFDMLNRSGNTAVRILVNKALGGAAAVNTRLGYIPQIPNTRLQPLDPDRFYLGDTTPHDSLYILQQILANQDSFGVLVKNDLVTNIYTDIGVRNQLAGNDFIVLANKIGLLDDPDGNNRHDVGIIYNTKTHKSYGYSYMTTAPYTNADATNRAAASLQEMGGFLLRFSGDWWKSAHKDQKPQTLSAPQLPIEKKILY